MAIRTDESSKKILQSTTDGREEVVKGVLLYLYYACRISKEYHLRRLFNDTPCNQLNHWLRPTRMLHQSGLSRCRQEHSVQVLFFQVSARIKII